VLSILEKRLKPKAYYDPKISDPEGYVKSGMKFFIEYYFELTGENLRKYLQNWFAIESSGSLELTIDPGDYQFVIQKHWFASEGIYLNWPNEGLGFSIAELAVVLGEHDEMISLLEKYE